MDICTVSLGGGGVLDVHWQIEGKLHLVLYKQLQQIFLFLLGLNGKKKRQISVLTHAMLVWQSLPLCLCGLKGGLYICES